MDHSIHTYLRQAKERATNEPLRTDIDSAGKTQAFYLEQAYTKGKFAAIIATLNSLPASTYVAGTQPVLYASKTFDILNGDPKNPVYVDMIGQAAGHIGMNPGSFMIGQTAAGKYLADNKFAVITEAIGDLNATLIAQGLLPLTEGQEWTVKQAVWAVASENMINANLDANPDVKFRVFAGTGMDDGSILLVNEVAKIIARNKASINGEAPSVFKGDPATALIGSTARLTGIYGADGIIAPTKKILGLRHVFACHPERNEEFHGPSKNRTIRAAQDDIYLPNLSSVPAGSGIPIIRATVDMLPASIGVASKTAFAGAADNDSAVSGASMVVADNHGTAMAELKGTWASALAVVSGGCDTALRQSSLSHMPVALRLEIPRFHT